MFYCVFVSLMSDKEELGWMKSRSAQAPQYIPSTELKLGLSPGCSSSSMILSYHLMVDVRLHLKVVSRVLEHEDAWVGKAGLESWCVFAFGFFGISVCSLG